VPTTETYVIGNFQVPLRAQATSVYQSVVPSIAATTTLANAIRSGLVSLGLLSGL
jgi:hypothetical protein